MVLWHGYMGGSISGGLCISYVQSSLYSKLLVKLLILLCVDIIMCKLLSCYLFTFCANYKIKFNLKKGCLMRFVIYSLKTKSKLNIAGRRY